MNPQRVDLQNQSLMNNHNHMFFNQPSVDQMTGVFYKNFVLKKKILQFLDKKYSVTINDLCKKLNTSAPKINTLLQELIDDQIVEDLGKLETGIGRRPNMYGLLSDSIYFLGVDLDNDSLDICLMDIKENIIAYEKKIKFSLENNEQSLERLCAIIQEFVSTNPVWKKKLVRIGLNVSGRVNRQTGHSHNYFNFHDKSLGEILKERVGVTTFIENDTRAKAFCEFRREDLKNKTNIIYINADYGIGLGAIVNGKLQYGKSGYSGELGHIPFFDNELICRCGKKGCLETEVSGRALVTQIIHKLEQGSSSSLQNKFKNWNDIRMADVIDAANEEDTLAIELIGTLASKLGKGITSVIHLYNPELIVFGGALTHSGDYFFLPLQMAINKYSLNLVKNDTKLEISKIKEGAGSMGACFLAKNKLLDSLFA